MTKERKNVEVVNNSSNRNTETHEKRKKYHKLNTESFIEKAISTHGDKYDYYKSIYNGWDSKVEIICLKHGSFFQTAGRHLKGGGCPKCAIEERAAKKRMTANEFILRSMDIHGNKYDYSKVIYKNQSTKVIIVCPIHGEFTQLPSSHLIGYGCHRCANDKLKRKIYGVATNDDVCAGDGKPMSDAYVAWRCILGRCYSKSIQEKQPCYKNCKVCDEWLLFSNFKRWFEENRVKGYAIDKDLTQHGITNKIYSPSTCNFVPQRINSLLTKNDLHRGKYKIGVQKSYDRYNASMSVIDGCRYIGTFDTENEAFKAYKREKEKYIKEVADDYFSRGLITERVRDLMYKYEVLEND